MLRWIFLLFSIATFAASFGSKSVLSLILLWLLSLVLFLLWAVAQYQAHAGNGGNLPMIDPVEMKRLREEAAARKAAQAGTTPDSPQS